MSWRRAGAKTREVSLPHTRFAVATYYLIATAEASSNLARFDGVRYGRRAAGVRGLTEMYERSRSEGFGAEVKRRILLGTYVLSAGYYDAYYRKAQQVRTLLRRDFDEAFSGCDVLITPTTPETAFRIGEKTSDPLTMYLSDVFTVSANLAGLARCLGPLRLCPPDARWATDPRSAPRRRRRLFGWPTPSSAAPIFTCSVPRSSR